MSLIYLSLGSNLNDRYANLRRAVDELNKYVRVTAVSPVFATEPWGVTDQPAFLNICVAAVGDIAPRELLARIKQIEVEMGREPTHRWGPRLIDIDILFFDDMVIYTPPLVVPHPRLHERAFVLLPLAEIAPDLIHPVLHKSVSELLDDAERIEIKIVK